MSETITPSWLGVRGCGFDTELIHTNNFDFDRIFCVTNIFFMPLGRRNYAIYRRTFGEAHKNEKL